MVTLLPIPTASLFGKVNSVISLTVLKLLSITILLLVKLSGMSKLVLSCYYPMVWMVKVLNILLPDLNVSFNYQMMILRFMNSTSKTVLNCNLLKLTSKFALPPLLLTTSTPYVDKSVVLLESLLSSLTPSVF